MSDSIINEIKCNADRIIKAIEDNAPDLTTIENSLSSILVAVNNIDADTTELISKIAEIKTELSDINANVESIETIVTEAKALLETIDADTSKIATDLEGLLTLVQSESDETQVLLNDIKTLLTPKTCTTTREQLTVTAGTPVTIPANDNVVGWNLVAGDSQGIIIGGTTLTLCSHNESYDEVLATPVTVDVVGEDGVLVILRKVCV